MKYTSKLISILLFAGMLLTSAQAASGSNERSLPLHGNLDTAETHVVHFPTIDLAIEGVGHASLLGKFAITMTGTLNIVTRAATGTAQFESASGDLIFTTVVGQATPTGTDEVTIVEIHTITGGTGRFAGASGWFTVERVNDTVALVATGTLTGTIVLPVRKS